VPSYFEPKTGKKVHLYILKSKCVLMPAVLLYFMRVIPGKELFKRLLSSSMQVSFVSFCLLYSNFIVETFHISFSLKNHIKIILNISYFSANIFWNLVGLYFLGKKPSKCKLCLIPSLIILIILF
jgi:hypothetical protein